jgi:NAD(P)-dependent dehydrogenase (short-subunit alcohol dehydrogenase family)
MSDISFAGRVAVVTGAGSGLGREYAIELARRGAQVVVNDAGGAINGIGTNQAAADRVVEKIRALGGEAVASYESVATVPGGENIIRTAVENFGKVDILINNAGIVRDGAFVNMSRVRIASRGRHSKT